MAKDLISDLQKCAPILLDAEFSGVYSVGEFNGGIDKSVDVDALVDGDCIFVGELPNFALYEGENRKSKQILNCLSVCSSNKTAVRHISS